MSKNTIVRVSQENSLAKVSNLISLTYKLLYGFNKRGIVLYNLSEYNLQSKTELAIILFIKKNLWLFLPQIIEKNDINYEYPRSFYRTRGGGTTLVDSEYDRKIEEKNETYILCSPVLDKSFESIVLKNITCSIAGKIITQYSDTSIGVVSGLKYK